MEMDEWQGSRAELSQGTVAAEQLLAIHHKKRPKLQLCQATTPAAYRSVAGLGTFNRGSTFYGANQQLFPNREPSPARYQ